MYLWRHTGQEASLPFISLSVGYPMPVMRVILIVNNLIEDWSTRLSAPDLKLSLWQVVKSFLSQNLWFIRCHDVNRILGNFAGHATCFSWNISVSMNVKFSICIKICYNRQLIHHFICRLCLCYLLALIGRASGL